MSGNPDTSRETDAVGALPAVMLVALLWVTPWPLGSRLPWADTLAATFALATGGFWFGHRLLRGAWPRWPLLAAPMSAFLGLGCVQLLAETTVYPFGTTISLRSYAAYAVTFLIAHYAGRRIRERDLLTATVIAVGLLVAVFAIGQHLTWNGKLFWFYDPPMGGTSPFGPFNNRNYFAGYMIATMGPALGLMLSPSTDRWRMPSLLLFTVGAASVVMSLSRGGLLALAVACVFTVVLAAALQRQGAASGLGRRILVPAGAVVLAVVLAAAVVSWSGQAGPVIQRFETILNFGAERSVGGRLEIWGDTLDMIADRPVLGTGLNTFAWGHLPYRSSSTGIPQHAHNEYLEMVAEAGLVGGAICVWFLWLLGTTVLRELRRAPPGFETGLRLGAVASWVGIMVYALTDFPTVIPATNYVLATLAGLACVPAGQTVSSRSISSTAGASSASSI